MNLEITPSLRGALAELYFREDCDQKGWAYISLEEIYNASSEAAAFRNDNVLAFRKGFRRINIRVMDSVAAEIREVCRPVSNKPGESPGFVFDYLACDVGQKDGYDNTTVVASPLGLRWVKVKTGRRSTFLDSQIDALGRIKLPLAFFCIKDVLAPPGKVEIEWDVRSGDKWLDELDDRRDQTEYDDEYY